MENRNELCAWTQIPSSKVHYIDANTAKPEKHPKPTFLPPKFLEEGHSLVFIFAHCLPPTRELQGQVWAH